MVATDMAAEAFQQELDEILTGLVTAVNKESAATVRDALEPTRESHRQLKEAAIEAKTCVERGTQMVQAIQAMLDESADLRRETEKLNNRLQGTVSQLDERLTAHREDVGQRLDTLQKTQKQQSVAILTTIVVTGLILLGALIAAA